MPVSIALLGVSGRMGRELLTVLSDSGDLRLSGASASPGSRWVGQEARLLARRAAVEVRIADDPAAAVRGADAAVAFALPHATPALVAACALARCPLVLGTTGHSEAQLATIHRAAQQIPIVMSSSFSVAVNVLFELARLAAQALGPEYDVAIVEAHHRHKRDAPSGTALSLEEAVALTASSRAQDAISFAAVRGGDLAGDHSLAFVGPGERIELTHRAHDRSGFALGALQAARWVVGRPPGLWSMRDVLGL
jgi:4-hydroxy-tetrahydrodipicolinate reductase